MFAAESAELGPVGFTAYASTSRTYGSYDPVIFDGVLSNFGDAYDGISSTFTCPVTGVYVISLTLTSATGDYAQAQITKESSSMLAAYADNDEASFNVAAVTSVFECSAGERVWVRTNASGSQRLYGSTGVFQRTGFSGFLLNAY